jgi:hypothetical protein
MKKLLLILLFIPLISFGQETNKVFTITIESGEVILSKGYRDNKAKRITDIQKIDGKFIRIRTNKITSIKQDGKELLVQNNNKSQDLETSKQKEKFVQSISYEDINRTPFLNYKNSLKTNEYVNKDGVSFKVGDTIVIGKPSNRNNLRTSAGAIQGAASNNFSYIALGSGLSIFLGGGLMANEMMNDERGKIVEIKMVRPSSKSRYKPYMVMNKLGGYWLGIKRDASTHIDLAFNSGEVKKYGYLSRDEALKELKYSKELLDLELISREEFEAKKKKLAKFILKNKK